jgi:hypothetical protein
MMHEHSGDVTQKQVSKLSKEEGWFKRFLSRIKKPFKDPLEKGFFGH